MYRLTLPAARTLHLAAQGLASPPSHPAGKADVLETIRRMGALQIDTIHIVNRSPYLVLWSRLGNYDPAWLDELLAEGALFEYWAHAACFLPIEEFGLFRRQMLDGRAQSRTWVREHPEMVERVLNRIRSTGPTRSSEWERTDGRASGWWDWKPEKHALEVLFNTGELMIARRDRFQRVYELRERVLPGWNDADVPTAEEVQRQMVLRTVRALGVTRATWVRDYYKMPAKGIPDVLEDLVQTGEVQTVTVEGWDEPWYLHRDNEALLQQVLTGEIVPRLTTFLSPFDPVVWDRARAFELFDFHYRIEVYTPAEKRRYGYFTMPILHRGALVGRIDPKAHRKEGVLEVKALHLEPDVGVVIDEDLVESLERALRDFAAWHGLQTVTVGASDVPDLAGGTFGASGTTGGV